MMALGAKGVISVVANIVPDRMSAMVHAALSGNWEEARQLHFKLFPLCKAMFMETNPIPVKFALSCMKKITGDLRLPLCELKGPHAEGLKEILKLYRLI
jgi:4-hydroxy-tetrahydrodipicolinate synthase